MQRESMEFDVVIVGAGPAGLSASIEYAKLCQAENKTPSICVLEKGSEVGAHILSGCVLEPTALNELIPDWQNLNSPLQTPVKKDEFKFLNKNGSVSLPTPPGMHNKGNYIVSLGQVCKWLAEYAENLGVEIYPGFAAKEVLFNDDGSVKGVATGDMGIGKDGQPKPSYQPGMELHAKQTLFAEGCRGSLSKQLIQQFGLDSKSSPQTYAIGFKEIWEIKPEKHKLGTVTHTIGWPLRNCSYGGSFIYHMDNNRLAIGLVIGLDYKNPYLNPYMEFQQFKHHPEIAALLEDGKILSYGARALNEGGFQSIPKLTFPGGCLIGCAAGFMNVPKIKGTHTAMKSGMLAANSIFKQLESCKEITEYPQALKKSWVWKELKRARNIRPGFRWGLWRGLAWAALDSYIFRGLAPWTLEHHADHKSLRLAKNCKKFEYPKPDGKISFDRLTSVARTNVFHEEDQIVHLQLTDQKVAIETNLKLYDAPEQRYCPAGVYEIVGEGESAKLQINAQNCIHCKTCDIKDPTQNITWVTPEGGGGPNYSGM